MAKDVFLVDPHLMAEHRVRCVSFGIVLMENATGHQRTQSNKVIPLLRWVCSSRGDGRDEASWWVVATCSATTDATGSYTTGVLVVGVWCMHPTGSERAAVHCAPINVL